MRFVCMWMFFVNLVKKKVWNWNSFAMKFSRLQMNLEMILVRTTFWTSSTLFSKHMCMRFNNNLDWICFLHDAFYFRKLPSIFVNSLDVFGICANRAFEEKMEVEMIYFWKDGEFSLTEFTNMLMMFVNRRRCMLQRQSSWNRRSPTITCCMYMTDNLPCLRVFPVWKKDLRVRSEAVVFWGIRV